MGLNRAAAILAIDNRFRTPSLELKCLGTSFNGKNKSFQSLGIQHGRRVIKTHVFLALGNFNYLNFGYDCNV